MAKGWYVVHTYSGHENKVQKHVTRLIESERFGDHLFDVKVPQEDVVEIQNGKKRVSSKKFLPGYILVEMDLGDAIWKDLTATIKQIQGVTGFVGVTIGRKPPPISGDEVRAILQKAGAIKSDRMMRPRQSFSVGETVRIVDGPFDSFTGTVEEVNLEKGKLRVAVGIFGRSTPVELDFLQVEKV
jgi:transcriptional antiterminator NusG